jgi:hypothetical protein
MRTPAASYSRLRASNTEVDMYTSPRISITSGTLPSTSRSSSGTSAIVRTLAVTSSPTRPSPRVAAVTSFPCSYRRLIANPSNLSSATNLGVAPSRPRSTRWVQAFSSSALMALSRLVICTACTIGAKVALATPRTVAVGDVSSTRSGWAASSARSSRSNRSYSASGISGASSW